MKKIYLVSVLTAMVFALSMQVFSAMSLDDAILKLWTVGPDASVEEILRAAAAGSSAEAEKAGFHLSCLRILNGEGDSEQILEELEAKAKTDGEKQTIATLKERLKTKSNKLPQSFQEKISLDFKDVDLRVLLPLIATRSNSNIVLHSSVHKKVTIRLIDATLEQALDTICAITDLHYENRNGVFVLLPKEKQEKKLAQAHYRLKSMSPSRMIRLLKAFSEKGSDENAPGNLKKTDGTPAEALSPDVILTPDSDKIVIEGSNEVVQEYLQAAMRLDLKDRSHKLSYRVWQLNPGISMSIADFAALPEKERNEKAKIVAAPAVIAMPGKQATIEVDSSSEKTNDNSSNRLDYKIRTIFNETEEADQLRIFNEVHVYGTSVVNGSKLKTNQKFANTIQLKTKKWVMLPLHEGKETLFLELMIEKHK